MKICNQVHASKSNFLGLSFNEKDEVFRKRQTYVKFGRIKKYFFLEIIVKHTDVSVFITFGQAFVQQLSIIVKHTNVSVFLVFVFGAFVQQLCVSCRRHYEEVKNTSNVLGPSAVTSKWVQAWKGLSYFERLQK